MAADVLAEDAEEDQLQGGGEEDADEHGGEAEGEGVPEEDFQDEVDEGDEE